MKFTSIIFAVAAILGSAAAAAAGSEQNTAVVNALRAKLAEREVSTKTLSEAMTGKVSKTSERHIVIPPLTRLTRCTVLFFGVDRK